MHIFVYIFRCSLASNFRRKYVLFYVNQGQFNEGPFRNCVNESAFLGLLTNFGNLCLNF